MTLFYYIIISAVTVCVRACVFYFVCGYELILYTLTRFRHIILRKVDMNTIAFDQ